MIIRQNKWHACRYGLDARLVDSRSYELEPVRQTLRNLSEQLAPTAERLGCLPHLRRVADLAAGPTGGAAATRPAGGDERPGRDGPPDDGAGVGAVGRPATAHSIGDRPSPHRKWAAPKAGLGKANWVIIRTPILIIGRESAIPPLNPRRFRSGTVFALPVQRSRRGDGYEWLASHSIIWSAVGSHGQCRPQTVCGRYPVRGLETRTSSGDRETLKRAKYEFPTILVSSSAKAARTLTLQRAAFFLARGRGDERQDAKTPRGKRQECVYNFHPTFRPFGLLLFPPTLAFLASWRSSLSQSEPTDPPRTETRGK